jgi:putative flavoprotein involved in K+ transport
MTFTNSEQRFDTVVIGGGQAGLSVGYYLARQGRDFVVLDANDRIGASWRKRWDSLRLFTPTKYNSLPGMPFPEPTDTFPTKDAVADYLEEYAARFHLPVRLNAMVNTLSREDDRYLLTVGGHRLETTHVVVATGAFQHPKIPAFGDLLAPTIAQFHSNEYHHPNQLQEGDALIVGAGNSGAEIALEVAKTRRTWLAGRDTGHLPKKYPPIIQDLYWWLIHKAVNTDNKIGRRFKELTSNKGAPLVGISQKDFERAGVERVPRMVGVQDGKPILQDRRVLDVANVIWCTGFVPNFRWIDLPVFGRDGYPVHARGTVEGARGLYFLGLPFQYTLTSSFIGGVGRDASYIAEQIAAQSSAAVEYAGSAATFLV